MKELESLFRVLCVQVAIMTGMALIVWLCGLDFSNKLISIGCVAITVILCIYAGVKVQEEEEGGYVQ